MPVREDRHFYIDCILSEICYNSIEVRGMDHKAYIRKVDGADTAVLLIHGIVGTPRQFDGLLDLFPGNWSIYNILLDGHGGAVDDFSHTSMEKWKQQVQKQLAQLCATYEKVMIVGHSMGTLLAMEASQDRPQVKALFLLNVPLCPRLKLSMAARSLGLALGLLHKDDPLRCATSVMPDRRVWRYLGWIPRYLELFRLCAKSRKKMADLAVPAWAVQSKMDEMVSSRSDGYLKDHSLIRYTCLENSGHFTYGPEDMAKIRRMLEQCVEMVERSVAFCDNLG